MRTNLWVGCLVTSFWFAACACPNQPFDSGTQFDSGIDGGIDAGPSYADGGEIEATGGCYDRNGGRKFILYFVGGGLCSRISFRRFDGGFDPLFAETVTAPENYLVDDARAGLCSMPFEQADGRLNQNAARVDSVRGVVAWAGYQAGRPWTYSAKGSLAFFGSEYWFSTPDVGSGLTDPCREP